MRTPRFSALLGALALALVPLPAGAGELTSCTFSYDPEVSPGLTTEASSGKVSSHGETGSAQCDGPVNGHAPTGPGTFGFEGTYAGVTCLSGGDGKGSVLLTVPTAAGPQRVKEPIDYQFGPAHGDPPGVGGWVGRRTTGRFVVLPTEGDCVLAPVTRLHGTGSFTVAGG